jgi:hypothetical protein
VRRFHTGTWSLRQWHWSSAPCRACASAASDGSRASHRQRFASRFRSSCSRMRTARGSWRRSGRLPARSPRMASPQNPILRGWIATDRMFDTAGSRAAAEESRKEGDPHPPAVSGRGACLGGCLPVLRTGELPDGHGGPRGRRPYPEALAAARFAQERHVVEQQPRDEKRSRGRKAASIAPLPSKDRLGRALGMVYLTHGHFSGRLPLSGRLGGLFLSKPRLSL